MTIQTLKEGLALMGATLTVTDEEVTVSFRGVTISIGLNIPEKELEGTLFFLNLSIPNWYKLAKDAIEEEKGGQHD